MALALAYTLEAHPIIPLTDAHAWEAAPWMICNIMRVQDKTIKTEWLKSVSKELKTLLDSSTFSLDQIQCRGGEHHTHGDL